MVPERPTDAHRPLQASQSRWSSLLDSPWAARALLFVVAMLALGRIRGEVVGANDASRYATIIALVEQGTFFIQGVPLADRTMDKVRIGGNELSSKPPLYSLIGAGVYALLYHGLGLSFDAHLSVVVFTLVALLVTLPLVLLLWRFHVFLQDEGVGAGPRLGATALLGLGTLCFPFGTILSNHVPSTAALFAALGGARALRTGRSRRARTALAAGFLASLAVTLEPIVLFPVVALTVYLALSVWRPAPASPSDLADVPGPPESRRTLALAFLAGATLPALLHFVITWHTTGGLVPVQLRPELWHYPGSYWNHPVSWDALAEPKWQYGLFGFFGGRGYFTLTPVLLLGLVGILLGLRRGGGRLSDGRLPRAEALLFLSGFALLAAYVISQTNNYGGGHYGMRWFLVTVPWLVLGLVPIWLSLRSRWARAGVALLVLPGLYTAQIFWFGKPTVYELLLMRWGLLVLPP